MVEKYAGELLNVLADYQYITPKGGKAKLYIRFVGYSDKWFQIGTLTFMATSSEKMAAIGTSIRLPTDMPLGTYDLQFMVTAPELFSATTLDKPGELRIVELTRPILSDDAAWFEKSLLANAGSVAALDNAMRTFLEDPDLRSFWDNLSLAEQTYITELYQFRKRLLL